MTYVYFQQNISVSRMSIVHLQQFCLIIELKIKISNL